MAIDSTKHPQETTRELRQEDLAFQKAWQWTMMVMRSEGKSTREEEDIS